MNSESDLRSNQSISIENLPTEFMIDLPEEANNGFLYLLMMAGVLLICVGGFFIIFGPDEIAYNVIEGMSFLQILQAYPGPIASVGVFITAIGGQVISAGEKKEQGLINEQIEAKINIQDDDIPEGYELSLNQVQRGKYRIELINKEEAEEARRAKEEEDDDDGYVC